MRSVTVVLVLMACALLPKAAEAESAAGWIAHADSLYRAGRYTDSGRAYAAAFALEPGSVTDRYNAACSWALAGEADRAMEQLGEAAARGYANPEWMQRDSDLETLHGVSGWSAIVATVQANLGERERDIDKPLRDELVRIYTEDQTLRHLLEPAEELYGRESDEMSFLWDLIIEHDSLNVVAVTRIIDEHGWPGRRLVGDKANTAVWLVVQHAPLEVQRNYLPLLRESVAAGESDGADLALLEDRILMRTGQKQKYGSQVVTDPETGEMRVHPIEDPEHVNERRAEVGLGPIEEYLGRWGIEFDPTGP